MEETNKEINKIITGYENYITYISKDFKKIPENEIFAKYAEKDFVEFYLTESQNRIKMRTYRFAPKENPKALIIFFHGLCGTMKTSAFLAKSLSENGSVVVGYDYRGHGKSEGKKLYFTSADQVINDSFVFVELMVKMYPGLPVYIGGISFGGFVSYQLSLRHSEMFKGVFLLAPALKPLQGCMMRSLANVVGSIFPGWYLGGKSGKSQITKNKFAIEKSLKKPKKKSVPASTLKAVVNGINSCEETFRRYNSNFIMFMGGQDKVIDANAAFSLIKNATSKEKKLYFYDNMYHNVLIEEEVYDIILKINDWLNNQFK